MSAISFTNNLELVVSQIDEAVEEAVKDAANGVVDDMAASFAAPKTGRFYGTHQASAAGEAPAVLEGDLLNSLGAERIGKAHWRVGVSDEKALWLEFGTSRMAPRPYFIPAMVKAQKKLVSGLKDNLTNTRTIKSTRRDITSHFRTKD